MGLEVKEKKIGRAVYRVEQLGTRKGRPAMVRLTKLLGPIMGKLLEGGDGKSVTTSGLAGALTELSDRISTEDLDHFCELFGEKTELVLDDGKRPVLLLPYQESWFAGHYGEMMQWLAFCAEVNFGDFFGAFKGLALGGGADKAA